jgi:hypothetical protein
MGLPSFRCVKVGERRQTMPFPLKLGWYVHGAVEEELTRLRKQPGGETLAYERRKDDDGRIGRIAALKYTANTDLSILCGE